jgi:hypothetical protein
VKRAWQGFQTTLKRWIGEEGVYLLCIVLGVKILFDAGFSTLVWTRQGQMDTNMRIYVSETNKLIQRLSAQLNDEHRLLGEAKTEIEGFKSQAIENQKEALSKMDESIRGITELLGDLRNFVNTRGYNPFTADEFDVWLAQTNARLRSQHLVLQLPPRPPHTDTRLREIWQHDGVRR